MTTRMGYLQELLDSIMLVSSGKKGAVSENRRLISDYDPSYYDILRRYLGGKDQRVTVEVISLLTALRERQALGDIKKLRAEAGENVSNACVGYLYSLDVDDSHIPDLIDILKHKRGSEFRNAALRMRAVGRDEDIPELRKIYGRVDGEMREQMRDCLDGIISRSPVLNKKRRMLLSVPVFPDEDKFMEFADKTTVYLDIRYRDNVSGKDSVSSTTYNNVAKALNKIQIRLFNEEANMIYYSKESKSMFDELNELYVWASRDLKTKKVLKEKSDSEREAPDCSRCGNRMTYGKDGWKCPICGGTS
jgi:ribosomal protein S27AE